MDALTSPSSSTPRKYDVFLSFRGEDTRKNFTDHLYTTLKKKGIHTFRDDEKLERGKNISTLFTAIRESQYVVVVFSRNYANSSWCLDEAAQIAECKEKFGQIVLPVFYDVEPSHVRKQEGSFGEEFAKLREKFKDNMKRVNNWTKALAEIASVSGWDLKDYRHESEVIQEIVKQIISNLTSPLSEDENLVGMDSRVSKVNFYLDKELNGVHTIGICGTGGIGKTTLANEVFKRIHDDKFEARGYVQNIREEWKDGAGLHRLRKDLYDMLLMDDQSKIQNVHMGIDGFVKRRLRYKKVLIVLDDVDDLKQIEDLVGRADQQPNFFGKGSRIIVTTRDKHLLKSYGHDNIYEIETLNDGDALKLLCRRAFHESHPKDEYIELSKNVVKYAQGLPLALEVIGSSLFGRNPDEWVDTLDRLIECPNAKISKILQISYDRLEKKEKEIFLDIACFFKGENKQRVKKIFESCGFNPTIGLSTLEERYLITIKKGKLWMHDLLQEMGRNVVREEKLEPGERSRIWLNDDFINVIKENTGTSVVQGIFLSSLGIQQPLNVESDPFSDMKNIRLLKICNVYLSGCPQFSLSKKLRLLEWHGYPLETLPSSFQPDKIVELSMPNSRIEQLWKEIQVSADKLTLINLRHCQNLTKTPDFTKVPNLESLILEGCKRLSEIHSSFGDLPHLVTLNLKDCESLERLPQSINWKSLEIFILRGCSNLKEFPEIVGEMHHLSELDLGETAITELPVSINRLTGLSLLRVSFCKNLSSLPDSLCGLTSLKNLSIKGCLHLDKLPEDVGNLQNLEQLCAEETSIRKVPSSILFLKKLKVLCFGKCKGLQLPNSLSGLISLTNLNLSDCDLPEGAIPDDIGCLSSLEHLNLSGNNFTSLPDTISELSQLKELFLSGCCNLQSLPKNLPSSLIDLVISGCPLLRVSDAQTIKISKNGFLLIDSDNIIDSVDNDSIFGTALPMPEEHIDILLPKFFEERINRKRKFEIRSPFNKRIFECCSNWNSDSSVMIKPTLEDYISVRKGIALFVVFEIKERENLFDESWEFKLIRCHIHTEKGCAENVFKLREFENFRVGSFGVCSYIPEEHAQLWFNTEVEIIGVSFSVDRPDLEIKKSGMHFIHEENMREFCQQLALWSSEYLDEELKLCQHYREALDEATIGYVTTIFGKRSFFEVEENNIVDDPSDPTSQMRRDVKSLLSRLYQGRIARTCSFHFLLPAKFLLPWFFHQSLGDTTICCYLPPNLHNDKNWLGLELYAGFERHQSDDPMILLGVDLYVHAGNGILPAVRCYIQMEVSCLGSHLVLYHIPRESLPELLNQSTGISVLFKPIIANVEVQFCGTGLLYEEDSKRLVQQITDMSLAGRPEILFSLHQQAESVLQKLEQRPEADTGCLTSFESEKGQLIESLHKLLTSVEAMTEDVSTSTLHNYRYGLRDEQDSDGEFYYSRSGVSLHFRPTSSPIQLSEEDIPEALACHSFYHLHVMVDVLVLNGNDFEKWKRNLEFLLGESFRNHGLVTLSLKGYVVSVFKYFNPLAPFNFNFPSKEMPDWFDDQSDIGSRSAIELPPNLHEDDNWMGLVICGSFSIHENPSSFSETSFKIICHLMTDRHCVNATPVHSITKDKFSWLHVCGFIWITYVPHALLTDMKESRHVLARIYNRYPGLTVNQCSIRLLYKQDLPEFKKAIIQCWTSFFDDLDPIFGLLADEDGKLLHDYKRVEFRAIRDKVPRQLNPLKTSFQVFDGESVFNACFPPPKTLEWFVDLRYDHLATIKLPPDHSDVNWIGLALYACFSNTDDQHPAATTSQDNLDSKLFQLFCHFETKKGSLESPHQYQYRPGDEHLEQLHEKGFIWVSFLPRCWFLETNFPLSCQLSEYKMEASFGSDARGMMVNKCGLRLVYQHDQEEFNQLLNNLMADSQQYSDQKATTAVQRRSPHFKNDSFHYYLKSGIRKKANPSVKSPTIQGSTSPTTQQQSYLEAEQSDIVEDTSNPTSQMKRDVESSLSRLFQETTLEDTKIDQSIAELDDIITDIQNSLDNKRIAEPESNENDIRPTFNRAKKIFKQFMKMKLGDLIHPGRKSELKDSLSILLSTKDIFPNDMVDEMTKFVETLDQNCHPYESAKEVIEKAKGKESVVVQLQNKLKQFTSDLRPMKTKVEAIDREIADLDKQLIEKKGAREKLKSSFDDLKGQAISTREALVEAKRDVEVVAKKKKEAEDIVKQIEDGWETLVASCSQHI